VNVVLLAYHYPPDPAVGSLRPAKVVHALRAAGHDVSVVTACRPEEAPGVRTTEPGLTVIAVKPQRNFREWYAARKRKQNPETPQLVSEQAWVKPARTPAWKQIIFSFLWLPDDRQGFILPAIRAARPLLARPDSVLYTTAPPFSSLLAGLWLRRRTRARWVVELRDPWTDNPWKPDYVRTRLSDAIERQLERRVLKAADLVVAVSDGIERVLRPKLANGGDRLIVIRNGIDRLLPTAEPASDNGPVRIVHVGSFYHGRDPAPFLEGLGAVRRKLGLTADQLQVDLVGECKWFAGRSVEQLVTSLGLADLVRFHDWVPHARAQEFVLSADALLLLAQNQPDQVPNKLYEYLGTRRPILAYVDESGESALMLRRAGGHYLVTSREPVPSEAAITSIATRARPANRADETLLRSWTAESQMQELNNRMRSL
jgi:glycosyltransferase involved in cell wall biosynthesis